VVALAPGVLELRGAPFTFFESTLNYNGPLIKREIFVAGCGGGGKSFGFLQCLAQMVNVNPGMRVLLTRATRESMTESTLVQWERCWPIGHAILNGPQREGRSIYHHPNGATVAAIGLDKPGKLFSTEWDAIYGEELTGDGTAGSDIPARTWSLFFRGLRGNRPFRNQHFLIATMNPSYPGHWCQEKILGRSYVTSEGRALLAAFGNSYRFDTYPSYLGDNPVYHDGRQLPDNRLHDIYGPYDPDGLTDAGRAYLAGYAGLAEHDFRRLVKGEWCVAEGRAFSDFSRETHVIKGTIERNAWRHRIHVKGWAEPVDIEWYFVSMDFGYRKPGVAQVWAVDGKDRMFRVAEIYESERQLDWWADKLVQLKKLYPFERGVGDSAEPRTIDFLNDRLGAFRGRQGPFIRPADKTRGKIFGFDQIRWGLSASEGGPRTFLLEDAFPFGKDATLAKKGKPQCFEDELDRAIWRRPGSSAADTSRNKEDLDPTCEDHAIDSGAYAHVFAWKKDLSSSPPQRSRFKPGTYGDVFRYQGLPIDYPNFGGKA
jgi:hypothetical protein